ncbi:MAG: FecR domain-containing protein [bacterium]|nr:FecR domain-containing protein [bacterium]
MRSQKTQQLIDKYYKGMTSAAEEGELRLLLEEEHYGNNLDEEKLLFELFDNNSKKELSSNFEDALELKILEKEQASSAKVRKMHPLRIVVGIAASLIFILGITWLNWPEPGLKTISESTQDSNREVVLPDGTTVYLNNNSSLSYSEDFNSIDRKLKLNGEAYFEVFRDESKPFIVESGNSTTTVLGTSFNIRNRDIENDIVITVTHGKVSFASHDNKLQEQVFLIADQMASYSKKDNVITKVEAEDRNNLFWQTGSLQFNSASVSQVIEDLQIAYGCNVEVGNSDILTCPFTGNFENESIENIIQVLAFSLNLKVNKTQNSYELIGKGCQIPL